ncbi:MAG TPA: hypothetical protein VK550_31835 [Polyangiaceae bacterium]|nr:hypothetical protein [Polyangiaceae bacterium]
MIPNAEAEIVRLFHGERWSVGTIASQLGVHHTTVQRWTRSVWNRRSWRLGRRWRTRTYRPSSSNSRNTRVYGRADFLPVNFTGIPRILVPVNIQDSL